MHKNASAAEIWKEKYTLKKPGERNINPSEWLILHNEIIKNQPKGKALDIACGNGRNSVYLSELGFEVDAVDISADAIKWLEKKARENQLLIHPIIMNLEKEKLLGNKYQVIINFRYLQRSLFREIKKALRPGGLIFFETFTKENLLIPCNDFNPDFLLNKDELKEEFIDFDIIDYSEITITGRGDKLPRVVAGIAARKN